MGYIRFDAQINGPVGLPPVRLGLAGRLLNFVAVRSSRSRQSPTATGVSSPCRDGVSRPRAGRPGFEFDLTNWRASRHDRP
jgi:hypothetical protein